ncbi:MAG: hypothetical protein Q9190_000490 [Brigantiaea leucoxantha]
MPSIRYYNQSAPFWDFVANLEQSFGGGADHPFSAAYNPESRQGGPAPANDNDNNASPHPEAPNTEEPSFTHPHHVHDHGHGHGHGPGFPFGGHHRGGPHPHRGGGPHGFRRGWGGRCGGFGGGGGGWPMGGNFNFGSSSNGAGFDLSKLVQLFNAQFDPSSNSNSKEAAEDSSSSNKDLRPAADVFDTEHAFVLHISLPGAKKEDVGVNWNADKSEVSVAGVIYRPGDEEFLKTLAMDEREVGVFERKVRLGSRASPASVDEEGMSARMEDGVLIVTVPKRGREEEGFVEVRKVDIE